MTTTSSYSSLKLPLTDSDFLKEVEKGKFTPLTMDVPFKKMEKVNRISDWSSSLFYSSSTSASASSNVSDGQWKAMASQGPKQKNSYSSSQSSSSSMATSSHGSNLGGKHHVVGSFKSSALRANALKRVLSCQIQKDWKLLEEIEFSRLSKLSLSIPRSSRSFNSSFSNTKSTMENFDGLEKIDTMENSITIIPNHHFDSSTLPHYDSRLAERLTPRTERTISIIGNENLNDSVKPIERNTFPILSEDISKEIFAHTTIYTSAQIVSLLMASPHTVIPWDIKVLVEEDEKDGSRIVILQASSSLSKAHVHETAIFKPSSVSGTTNWSQQQQAVSAQQTAMIKKLEELTFENSCLSNSLPGILSSLQGGSCDGDGASSASSLSSHSLENLASSERHTLVSLGDGCFLRLVGNVDAMCSSSSSRGGGGGGDCGGEKESVLVSSLLEFNSSSSSIGGWRQKLDNQRGALLVQEFRDNTAYLARKAYQSMVMDVDRVAIGWFSRSGVATKHGLLAVQEYSPEEMITQMNLNAENAFGILRALVDLFGKLPVGKEFRLLRDANRPVLKLYQIGCSSLGGGIDNSSIIGDTIGALEDDIFSGIGDITEAMGHLNS